jgi:uncharacterized cupin superfamily protein
MTRTNIEQMAWTERKSPKGRFHIFYKEISLAIGGKRDGGDWNGGHPFDLSVVRVPPGAANFPYHSHATQWEMYVVISGSGQVRLPDGMQAIAPGDTFMCPPGESHQILNAGTEDLVYHVIADNPRADVFTYPDSGKVGFKPGRKYFVANSEVDYYLGEE